MSPLEPVVAALTGRPDFRLAVVTGPQRSGTTFASRALARDAGWDHVGESEFGVHSYSRWIEIIKSRKRSVVHCPTMVRHLLETPDDVLIVFMHRPVDEILASQRNLGWGDRGHENTRELARFDLEDHDMDSCRVKQQWWWANRHHIPRYRRFDIDYHAMSTHPAWVPAEQRVDWAPKQTERKP